MVRRKQCKNEDATTGRTSKQGFKGKGQITSMLSRFRGVESQSTEILESSTLVRISPPNDHSLQGNYTSTDRDGPQQSSSEDISETELKNDVVVAVVEFVKSERTDVIPEKDAFSTPTRQSVSICSNGYLHNSYIDSICGNVSVEDSSLQKDGHLSFSGMESGEPMIRQSVECMFAHQFSERFMEDRSSIFPSEDVSLRYAEVLAPSALQQCIMKNRSPNLLQPKQQLVLFPELSRRETYTGMLDSNFPLTGEIPSPTPFNDGSADKLTSPSTVSRQHHCQYCPSLLPTMWPQRPLLLRPTPRSGTRVKGIRLSGCKDYIWNGKSHKTPWNTTLQSRWQKRNSTSDLDSEIYIREYECSCPMCMILPINNGNELDGESLVTDFESDLFDGSLLVRIRGAEGTTKDPYDDTKGYFSDVQRKYQVVIQGRFKKPLHWTECVSGIKLDRPCGKLPSKWMLKGALNVIKFFAPQLDASVDGSNPYSLSPLGSMPQTVIVENVGGETVDISGLLREPTDSSKTLLNSASKASSSIQRARARKKAFDKLFADKQKEFMTDPGKVYTFEFLQHLICFDDLSVELGSIFGSVQLSEILDGQPIQICALCPGQKIWSFDVWHELLHADAMRHEAEV